MRRLARSLAPVLALALALALACDPHKKGVPLVLRGMADPAEPVRVAGNVYFVGTSGIGVFLITTPAGHILIDSAFEASVELIRASVERLGFRFADIKILLSSHAHVDHVQGHARIKELTGARVLASAGDAPVIAGGGKGDFAYERLFSWRPCPVDGLVADGAEVSLGGVVLTAHLTPGHTRGATTWTMEVKEGGRALHVVFFPSGNVNLGVPVRDNPRYPEIAQDYQHSFAVWKALSCDVVLGAHTDFFDLAGKRARVKRGEQPNPFIDPAGYRRLVADQEKKFQVRLGE
jgi:metallo-beta-lactamase class B